MADAVQQAKEAPTNPRGIPYAPFVTKVEDYVTTRAEVEGALKSFQEMISKYTFMQTTTTRRATSLREKIPDYEKTLQTIRFLAASASRTDEEPLEAFFELNDTLYARAEVRPSEAGEVYLWLGANVMVGYGVAEAEALLREKVEAARKSLEAAEEDLDFLREQITTMEVATARVYNWDVGQRRKETAEGGRTDEKDGPAG